MHYLDEETKVNEGHMQIFYEAAYEILRKWKIFSWFMIKGSGRIPETG
jgi:hypothetical protein